MALQVFILEGSDGLLKEFPYITIVMGGGVGSQCRADQAPMVRSEVDQLPEELNRPPRATGQVDGVVQITDKGCATMVP